MPARVDPGVNLFQGARVGRRTEVRIDGIVHVGSVLPPSSLVPIKWIAVGDPAQLISPDQHEEIDKVLGGMQFPRRVYPRSAVLGPRHDTTISVQTPARFRRQAIVGTQAAVRSEGSSARWR